MLASQEAASTNPRITAIIRGAEEKNSQVIAKGGSLAGSNGELLQEYRKDQDSMSPLAEVLARNSRVDVSIHGG